MFNLGYGVTWKNSLSASEKLNYKYNLFIELESTPSREKGKWKRLFLFPFFLPPPPFFPPK